MSDAQLQEQIADQPPATQDEILRINDEARPQALQIALLVPLLVSLLGSPLVPDDAPPRSGAFGRRRARGALGTRPSCGDPSLGRRDGGPPRVRGGQPRPRRGTASAGALLLAGRLAQRDEPRRSGRRAGDSGARSCGAARDRRRARLTQVPRRPGLRRLHGALLCRVGDASRRGRIPLSAHRGSCRGDRRLPADRSRGASLAAGSTRSRPAGGMERAIRRLLGPRRDGRDDLRRAGGDRAAARGGCRGGCRGRGRGAIEIDAAVHGRPARENEALGEGRAGRPRADWRGDRKAPWLRQGRRRALLRSAGSGTRPLAFLDRRRRERDGRAPRSAAERAGVCREPRGDDLRAR